MDDDMLHTDYTFPRCGNRDDFTAAVQRFGGFSESDGFDARAAKQASQDALMSGAVADGVLRWWREAAVPSIKSSAVRGKTQTDVMLSDTEAYLPKGTVYAEPFFRLCMEYLEVTKGFHIDFKLSRSGESYAVVRW